MSFSLRAAGAAFCLLTAQTVVAQYAYDYDPNAEPTRSPSGYSFASDLTSDRATDDSAKAVAPAAANACGCANECGCNACCDCCHCGCGPLWTVKAGAVILTRANPHPAVLIQNTTTGAAVANAQDFNFNWAAGPDISISRAFGDSAFEARYFGVDGWQANQTFTTPAIWNFPTNPPLFGLGVANIDAVYASRLDSLELNLRRRWSDRFGWLIGFRWIELHEELNFNADFGGNQADINFNTDNHLYGGQIGFDWRVFDRGGPFAIDSVFKAGIFGNAADNDFVVAQQIGPAFGANQARGQVAFVGEIGVTGVYQWTDHVALRGGYQLLWVEGVALASDQISAINVLDADGIDTLGGVLYHGALMSVDFTW